MSLLAVPEDIFFEILLRLWIVDVLSLMETCASLRAHFFSRSTWILVLSGACDSGPRPLPCPPKQDFTKLDLLSLQKIGLQARRLDRNFGMARPRPNPHIQVISTDPNENILLVIPGTSLIITHNSPVSITTRQLRCWDTSSGTCVARLEIGRSSLTKSSPLVEDGKCTFVVDIHRLPEHFMVGICVNYQDRDAITMEVVFELPRSSMDARRIPLYFIDDEITGVIASKRYPIVSCTVFNLKTGSSMKFTMELSDGDDASCYLFRKNLYILVQGRDHKVVIHHIPPEHLPYSQSPNIGQIPVSDQTIVNTSQPYPDTVDWGDHSHQSEPVIPAYGAHAVTTRIGPAIDFSTTLVTFYFFPVEIVPHESAPLSFGPAGCDFLVNCSSSGSHTHFVCATGACVVICTRKPKGQGYAGSVGGSLWSGVLYLQLLRFVKDPAQSITVQELDLPTESIDLHRVKCVAMDDHLGLIFLMEYSGTLSSISYP